MRCSLLVTAFDVCSLSFFTSDAYFWMADHRNKGNEHRTEPLYIANIGVCFTVACDPRSSGHRRCGSYKVILCSSGVGKCPILGILDITFKYLLEIISPILGWCSIGTFNDPCSWLLPNDPLLCFIGLSRILPPSSLLEFCYIPGGRGRQRGIAARQLFFFLARREGLPPLPPTPPPFSRPTPLHCQTPRSLRCFVALHFFGSCGSRWVNMAQHKPQKGRKPNIAPRWPNVACKLGPHSPKMAPRWAHIAPKWANNI